MKGMEFLSLTKPEESAIRFKTRAEAKRNPILNVNRVNYLTSSAKFQ